MALLEIKNVSKRFGGLRAVSGVTLSISDDQVAFIVGPNGAGKTTLFNLITGVHHADSGEILFGGREITHLSSDKIAKLGVGRTFQIVKPLRNLTVLENVMLGAFLHTPSPVEAGQEATRVLTFLGMQSIMHLPAIGLGTATMKRLEIARALATKPKLILLDEVVSGLATSEALKLADLLKRLPEWGVSVVAGVEHVMQVVMKVAQRVVVLDRGKIIAEGEPQDIVHREEVIEAYLGPKYKQVIQ